MLLLFAPTKDADYFAPTKEINYLKNQCVGIDFV